MSSKIVKAEVFVTSPSRNFVTLRLTPADGVIGIGQVVHTCKALEILDDEALTKQLLGVHAEEEAHS